MLLNQENTHFMLVDMELKILEERENPFFKRKELKILINHANSATPSKNDLIKELAGKNSVDASQVVVDYIFSKKGLPESFAKVKILREKSKAVAQKKEKKNEAQTSASAQTPKE